MVVSRCRGGRGCEPSLHCPGKLRGIQQDALELLLGGESGQEAPSSLRTDRGTSSLPPGVPWRLASRAAPTLPISRVKPRKGRLMAVLIESLSCTHRPFSPKGNHHRRFPSFRTQTSLESRFRPLLFGGGGSCERNREAWSGGDGGQGGCRRARASPRARLPPPASR